MKVIFSLVFFFSCFFSFSQDVITKKDGSTLKVKVVDILDDLVKYKKVDNIDGPTYQLSTDKITKITYGNGSTDTFGESSDSEESTEEKGSVTSSLDDENFKRMVEALAKDAGEQLIDRCAGVKDNFSTDIYWDGVYKDVITGDVSVPIRVWWNKKWAGEGNKKWIKGKIILGKTGEKKWVFQASEGSGIEHCGKNFKFK